MFDVRLDRVGDACSTEERGNAVDDAWIGFLRRAEPDLARMRIGELAI